MGQFLAFHKLWFRDISNSSSSFYFYDTSELFIGAIFSFSCPFFKKKPVSIKHLQQNQLFERGWHRPWVPSDDIPSSAWTWP